MADLKEKLQSKIPQICRTAGIEMPTSVVRLESGVVIPAFCVNDKYVIRFNVRDLDIKKFQREKIAFDLLGQRNAPVPKVIWLDESRDLIEADILVTERLAGQSISCFWKTLDANSQQALVQDAAKILKEIHEIKVSSFGPLDSSSKKYHSWPEYLGDCLQEYCRSVSGLDLFSDPKETEKNVWMAFKKIEPLLMNVREARLVHGDFHFANLIGVQAKLTGVVDFEWSIGGDPALDFRSPTNISDSANGADKIFFSEYHKLTQIQPDELKIDFYRMLIRLELMSVSVKHWVGKVPWGEENHRRIMKTFNLTLKRVLDS